LRDGVATRVNAAGPWSPCTEGPDFEPTRHMVPFLASWPPLSGKRIAFSAAIRNLARHSGLRSAGGGDKRLRLHRASFRAFRILVGGFPLRFGFPLRDEVGEGLAAGGCVGVGQYAAAVSSGLGASTSVSASSGRMAGRIPQVAVLVM
jgi:hypothetical protein